MMVMTDTEHDLALGEIAGRLLDDGRIPDYIVIAEDDPDRLYVSAVQLAQKLGLSHEKVIGRSRISRISSKAKVLIFDDIYRRAKHIGEVEKMLGKNRAPDNIWIAALVLDAKVNRSRRFKNRKSSVYFGGTQDTDNTRTLFHFENTRRIYTPMVEFFITREKVRRGTLYQRDLKKKTGEIGFNNDTEVLVQQMPDGKYIIPGGRIGKGELPKQAAKKIYRIKLGMEMPGMVNFLVPNSQIKHTSYFVTRMEPDADFAKPYTSKMQHYVLAMEWTDEDGSLPGGFKWVKFSELRQNLRWSGQRELVEQLVMRQ